MPQIFIFFPEYLIYVIFILILRHVCPQCLTKDYGQGREKGMKTRLSHRVDNCRKSFNHNDMSKTNIAIFVSGSGSNCENLIRHFEGSSQVCISLVVSNRQDAYALVRAERLGVPSVVVSKAQLHSPDHLLPLLEKYNIQFIVLAGFLPLIPNYLIERYPRRIVNLHPALLPKYGGKGMWGHHVHEAVKAAGEKETGMTVHYVSEVCDGGEIIAQFSVPLSPDDSVDDIAAKEHELEMRHFPEVVERLVTGE